MKIRYIMPSIRLYRCNNNVLEDFLIVRDWLKRSPTSSFFLWQKNDVAGIFEDHDLATLQKKNSYPARFLVFETTAFEVKPQNHSGMRATYRLLKAISPIEAKS